MLRVVPALAKVQFILRPTAGLERSRVCKTWCASSYRALMPFSGALPECDARPFTARVIEAIPLVDRDNLSDSARDDSTEKVASCSAPSLVSRLREPGELISSSALISTVTVPYCWKFI